MKLLNTIFFFSFFWITSDANSEEILEIDVSKLAIQR